MTGLTRRAIWGFAGLAALAVAGCTGDGMMASDSKTNMTATLSGANSVPPKTVPGTGKAMVMLDKGTKMVSWEVTYSGLTGPATASHFHGPAEATGNAGVALPIAVGPSPMKGSATLTDAQMADLVAGKWYVNIHTAANPPGEIRGQVKAGM
jgi:hypothetical protein